MGELDRVADSLFKYDQDKVDRVYAEIEAMSITEMLLLARKMNVLVNNLAQSSANVIKTQTKRVYNE